MRLPFTILDAMPNLDATCVARLPPPCTNIFLPSKLANNFKNALKAAASSMMFPPIFTMASYSITLRFVMPNSLQNDKDFINPLIFSSIPTAPHKCCYWLAALLLNYHYQPPHLQRSQRVLQVNNA